MIASTGNILCCFRKLPIRKYCLKVSLLFWIITCLVIYSHAANALDGNKNAQEFADPLYRQLGIPFFENIGHAALYAGMDPNDNHKILEIQLFTGIREFTLESMSSDVNLGYWGAYNSKIQNRPTTFADRQTIINTAIVLDALDPGYPFLAAAALVPEWFWGTRIEPDEINELRCDGLVEYAYEYNEFPVWGKNLATNPDNYDISKFPSEHNNLYEGYSPHDPDIELAPVVQCGKKGGTSTNMVNPAVIDYPTINVYVTTDASCQTL